MIDFTAVTLKEVVMTIIVCVVLYTAIETIITRNRNL